jgi:hypothetical protein
MREDRPLDLNAAVPAMLCVWCGVVWCVSARPCTAGCLLARKNNNNTVMREDARAVSSAALASGSMLHRSHTTLGLGGNNHTTQQSQRV